MKQHLHLTEHTDQNDMQASEEATAAQLHESQAAYPPFQVRDAYIGKQAPASSFHESHLKDPEYQSAIHAQPSLPSITLSYPTPPSPYEEPSPAQNDTEQSTARQSSPEAASLTAHQHPQEQQQSHHLMPRPPPPHSPTPLLKYRPRPAKDVQEIFKAMATNIFNTPIFGDQGAAFHARPIARYPPRTPRRKQPIAVPDIKQQRNLVALSDMPEALGAPTPQPKAKSKPKGKRKRDLTPVAAGAEEVEFEWVVEEPVEKKIKAVREEGDV